MKQTQTIPEMVLGVGYLLDRAGLPLDAVRVPVPQPAADEVLIRVKTLVLNTPDYLPEVHYHQVRDAWHGLRTPSGQ